MCLKDQTELSISFVAVVRGQDGGPDTIRSSVRRNALRCCVLRIGRDSWSSRGVIHGRLPGEPGREPERLDGGELGVGPDKDITEGAPYDVARGISREITRAAP